jgi:Xaa-Pro aminopeptidase
METMIANRLKRVRQALEAAAANALLETHPPNVFYLSGFTGDSGVLLLESSSVTLFTDGRFTIQAREEARGIRVQIHRGSLLAAIGDYLRRKRRIRAAIAPSRLSLASWNVLKKAAGKSVRWVAMDGVVDQLRAVKDASEIDQIREAARVGSEVMEEVMKRLGKGEGTVTYGLDAVEQAVKMGAVEKLVLADTLLRESHEDQRLHLEELMRKVEQRRGSVTVVSTEHEAGVKLLALGGIAALLRFPIYRDFSS